MFTTEKARDKMGHAYPQPASVREGRAKKCIKGFWACVETAGVWRASNSGGETPAATIALGLISFAASISVC